MDIRYLVQLYVTKYIQQNDGKLMDYFMIKKFISTDWTIVFSSGTSELHVISKLMQQIVPDTTGHFAKYNLAYII